ncbi:MAG TPA: NAD(P)/FAD-dependent oxidoreductase, partial [Bryobacteraceae bacterium]|nr:NAD(P)/FAD-dependent oxidoreductase [Bryobacteraceae bacterium]
GARGRRGVVLEHNGRIGRKILISGGGRCNFTNLQTTAANFLSANPHFAKSALARYRPADFLEWIRRHEIPFHEKAQGQLFCDRSAGEITSLLQTECARAKVRIETSCRVRHVRRDERFVVETDRGVWTAGSLVVATGGLSIPKIGATSFGYDLARQFGLSVRPCRPALVPLVFGAPDQKHFGGLAGVSLEVRASTGGAAFRDKMLFTHRGLSGPAILQISSYWQAGEPVEIDLAPDADLAGLLARRRTAGDRAEVQTVLSSVLPKRLAARWLELQACTRPVSSLSDREIREMTNGLHAWCWRPAGTEGYAKAEVTAGGLDTAELSSQTMEARKVPGLYFIGEVVDVTGQLGGFNFQWAWASGYAAGQYV